MMPHTNKDKIEAKKIWKTIIGKVTGYNKRYTNR